MGRGAAGGALVLWLLVVALALAPALGRRDRDPWSVLGVPRGASAREISSQFRRLARQCHPDKQPRNAARWAEISRAYDLLQHRGSSGSSSSSSRRRGGFRYDHRDNDNVVWLTLEVPRWLGTPLALAAVLWCACSARGRRCCVRTLSVCAAMTTLLVLVGLIFVVGR